MVLREGVLSPLQPSGAGSVGFAWLGWLLPGQRGWAVPVFGKN